MNVLLIFWLMSKMDPEDRQLFAAIVALTGIVIGIAIIILVVATWLF